MSRFVIALLLICFYAEFTHGMECTYDSNKNIFEKVFTSCPRPLIDSSDNSYCCYDFSNESFYCCSLTDYAKNGLGIVIPVVIAAVVIIGLILCCISCLCCSCCPWYRRRQGTVYGKVQTPIVQVIQPQPFQNTYASYPTNSTGMSQPPPYNEAYAKQAPYNPAYPPAQ